MKLSSLFTACVMVLFLSTYASGASSSPVYLAPRLSLTIQHARADAEIMSREWGPKNIYAAKPGASLAVGMDLRPCFDIPLRFELEYGTWEHVSKTGKARIRRMPMTFRAKLATQTLLFNAYWDIPLFERITPYLGLGAGLAFVRTELTALDEHLHRSHTAAAGQVGAGITYRFTPRVSAELSYRFLMTGSSDLPADAIRLSLHRNYAHQIMLGLRFYF